MARTVDEKRRMEMAYQAFAYIAQKGPHKATLTDVAKELKMNRSSLYWYFKSISQILITVLKDIRAQEQTFIEGYLVDKEEPLDWIEAFLKGLYDFYQDKESYLVIMFQLTGHTEDKDIQAFLQEGIEADKAFRLELIQLIKACMDEGEILPHDPTQIVDSIWSHGLGLLIHSQDFPVDGHAQIELYVRGMLAPLLLGTPPQTSNQTKG